MYSNFGKYMYRVVYYVLKKQKWMYRVLVPCTDEKNMYVIWIFLLHKHGFSSYEHVPYMMYVQLTYMVLG